MDKSHNRYQLRQKVSTSRGAGFYAILVSLCALEDSDSNIYANGSSETSNNKEENGEWEYDLIFLETNLLEFNKPDAIHGFLILGDGTD